MSNKAMVGPINPLPVDGSPQLAQANFLVLNSNSELVNDPGGYPITQVVTNLIYSSNALSIEQSMTRAIRNLYADQTISVVYLNSVTQGLL